MFLCLLAGGLGSVDAENAFQVRYFYPSSGLDGLQLEAQYNLNRPNFSVGLRLQELSTFRQSLNVSLSSGAWFSSASVSRSRDRQGGTYTAVVGYSAPDPGLLGGATLTYVRADDERPTQGYSLNSVSLDLDGRLSPSWKWTSGASFEHMHLNATPSEPQLTKGLSFGLDGKLAQLGLRARTRLTQTDTAGVSAPWRWNLGLDADAPLTPQEKLSANFTYNSQGKDSEGLSLSSTRFKPLTLTTALNRASGTLSARLGANYEFSEALSLAADYSLSFTGPLSHSASLSLDYRAEPWTASASLGAELSPGSKGGTAYSLSPALSLSYQTKGLTTSLRGNARYTSDQSQPWSYHLDASLQTQGRPLNWVFGLNMDSPTNTKPFTAEASVQALYTLKEHWQLNSSLRYRTGVSGERVQFGIGVRYVF